MRNSFINYITTVIRIILSCIFLTSSLFKLLAFNEFVVRIKDYNILQEDYVIIIASIIVLIELVAGILLALNIYLRSAALLSVIIFSALTLFVLWSVLSGKDYYCNCFGNLFESRIGIYTLLRNITFLLLSTVLYYTAMRSRNDNAAQGRLTNVLGACILIIIMIVALTNWINPDKKMSLKVGFNIEPKLLINSFNLENNTKYKYYLLVFLSATDCPKCLLEATLWNKINEEYSNEVFVAGIVYPKEVEELKRIVKEKRIRIPYIIDVEHSWFSKYVLNTPLRILMDNNGVILSINKPNGTLKMQDEFILYLKEIMEHKDQ